MCKLFDLAVLFLKISLRKVIIWVKTDCIGVLCSIVGHTKNLGAVEVFSMGN